jgi:hypothetical protein
MSTTNVPDLVVTAGDIVINDNSTIGAGGTGIPVGTAIGGGTVISVGTGTVPVTPYGGCSGGQSIGGSSAGVWTTGSVQIHQPAAPTPSRTEQMLQELLADSILRRIPDRRIKSLRVAWFGGFLKNENAGVDERENGDLFVTMWDGAPPPGVIMANSFSFLIMGDDSDSELLLANRLEAITYICRGTGKSPTQVITEVEKTAAPLERLAQVADDE